jgi:hypothetical protein
MLPIWLVTTLPTWLVIFIVLYALAALYVAIKFREVRKFLAGAFFVSSGMLWYLWLTDTSIPFVIPKMSASAYELGVAALLGFGTTSSSIVGARLGLYVQISKRILACILAFAAGALISALAIDKGTPGAASFRFHVVGCLGGLSVPVSPPAR